ncbi:MAG: PspA/IM30 family protein [Polyangia bacterium]
MNILERLRDLIASNVNALLDSLTDPGAAIDELIANMEAAAREARTHVKDALTEDKRAARLRETTERSVAEWQARAERAVKAGDDGLAKEALAQISELKAQLDTIDADRSKARTELAEMEHGLRDLDRKLSAVRSRKETLKAVMRARATGGDAAARYDEIVTGVDRAEAENDLDAELDDHARTRSVSERIDRLDVDRDVADRLAAMKAKLNKG